MGSSWGDSPNQQWWGYNGNILGYADICGHSTGDNDESVQMGAIIHRGPVESLVFWRFLSTFCGIPRTELLGFALFEALFLFHFLVLILWFCLYDWVFVFFPPYYFRVTAHHLHHLAWSCARCNPGKLLRVAYLQPNSCHLSDGPHALAHGALVKADDKRSQRVAGRGGWWRNVVDPLWLLMTKWIFYAINLYKLYSYVVSLLLCGLIVYA